MSDSLTPQSPDPDEPDFQKMLSELLGSNADNPQLAEALKAMGIDRLDPAAMGMISAQLQAMFSSDPGEVVQRRAGHRRRPQDGQRRRRRQPRRATARREVEEAAHVAGLWLDDVTQLTAPGVAARAWSRAEWVDQTMPVWRTLVEPVAAGVSAAIVAAMRGQMGSLRPLPAAAGTARRAWTSGAMMGQMEPMLARMSASMFGAQVGQAVGALAGDLLSGTEVGLPARRGARRRRCCRRTSPSFAEGLEVDLAEVRLYLAVREAARVRLFADVPWLGAAAGRRGAGLRPRHQHRHRADRVGAAVGRPHRPGRDAVGAVGLRCSRPEPSAAQRAALGRLETYLALVEGWVDVVAERATAGHLPHGCRSGRGRTPSPRHRRPGRAAVQPAWSGSSCARAGCATPPTCGPPSSPTAGSPRRDGAWAHPDVAPTAADLDDPLGYVERVRGARGGDDLDAALDAILREGESGSGTA